MDKSWNISDLVAGSNSEPSILAPDSDCDDVEPAVNQTKSQSTSKKITEQIIISSDEETSNLTSDSSSEMLSISTVSQASRSQGNVRSSSEFKKDTSNLTSDSSSEMLSISTVSQASRSQGNVRSSSEFKKDTSNLTSDSSYKNVSNSTEKFNLNVSQATCRPENIRSSSESIKPQRRKNKNRIVESDEESEYSIKTPIERVHRNDYRNVIEDDESDDESNNKKVITIESESDDDKPELKKTGEIDIAISGQLNTLKISTSPNKEPLPKLKFENNDYLTRLDSLRAEETRLKVQVSEVMKNIDTLKTTLRTANLSALPDKGVRLQVSLKKGESKLRDLRYQQSSLANEIIKLQMHSKMSKPHTPAEHKAFNLPTANTDINAMGQKVHPNISQPHRLAEHRTFNLPTANTDINAMGRQALETHRTQQALTVDALKALHNSLKGCPNEDTYVDDPRGLQVNLMPHQKHALAWLLWREKEKPSGGILADDMGLGKTLSLISLILKSREENEENEEEESDKESDSENHWISKKRDALVPGETLVICPASLIDQWAGELKKRVKKGILDVLVHHGTQREKKARRLARHDVVITTYSILPRESTSQGPLFGIRWKRVIIDEAHQIRNHKTQTAQSIFQLKAKHRWALTGTPVHNKEIDLYALLKFLRCSPFDDLTVWKRWVDNRDAAGIQRLNTITKSLMLRRTKQGLQEQGQLVSLKDKNFHTIFTTLDKDEQSAYEKLLKFSATLFAQFLHQKAERSNALPGMSVSAKNSNYLKNLENPFENHPDLARLHKQMKEVSDIKSHHILVLILRLRQFCCHPALITTMFEKEDMTTDGIEDTDGLDFDLMEKMTRLSLLPSTNERQAADLTEKSYSADLTTQNPLFAKDRLSSKMQKVVATLDDILKSNDKVVVVSQWVSLLEVIHTVLKERKVKCVSLNGKVPVKDRGGIVENFNRKDSGPRVILLSLTAGGVGLNLVAANHLLLLDLHWNPQLESQACDRIYRVGQDKDVHVYKFVVSETIEERILNLQKSKLSMANDVLTGAKHTSKLTLDDLKMLFQIKQ